MTSSLNSQVTSNLTLGLTLERDRSLVRYVTSSFAKSVTYKFTPLHTQTIKSLFVPPVRNLTVLTGAYLFTNVHTRERNLTSATGVTKHLSNVHTSNLTHAHTLMKSHTSVLSVTNHSRNSLIWLSTSVHTPVLVHTSVSSATSPFPSQLIWKRIVESILVKSHSHVRMRDAIRPSLQKANSNLTCLFTQMRGRILAILVVKRFVLLLISRDMVSFTQKRNLMFVVFVSELSLNLATSNGTWPHTKVKMTSHDD